MIPEINLKKTAKNVRHFFKYDYPGICLRAGKKNTGLKAVVIDGMPKSPSYRNHTEDAIYDQIQREVDYEKVVQAVKALDIKSQDIIIYNLVEKRSNEWCYMRLHMSPSRYDDYKRFALNAFADAYEYQTSGVKDLHEYTRTF